MCMAKRTRAEDFRSLSEEDIEKEIYECHKSILFARIAQKQRKVPAHQFSLSCRLFVKQHSNKQKSVHFQLWFQRLL